MIVYEKPGFLLVTCFPDENYILFDWTDFMLTLDEVKEFHEKALAVAREKDCYYYIAETSKVRTALRPEVIAWWSHVWMPKLIEARLKAIVTVVPSTVVAALSTYEWQRPNMINGPFMRNVDTLEEARTAVKELQAEDRS